MAVIRDVMPAFELYQPTSVEGALALLERHGSEAWVLAGGLDTFDWLKDRAKRVRVVVDLSQVEGLRGIREVAGGLEIGATTTLTEVVRHPVVQGRYGLLREAAELVASPQIRNQGTLGGNLSQDTRCWYYRSGWTCYRAGGNICYADTPTAVNREHAILEADRCVAVSPSDTAPALIALEARVVLRSGRGEREVAAEDYFVGPGVDITQMTGRRAGELLTAIRVPGTWAGVGYYFEKVRDRQVWDFPLVNVAAVVKTTGGTITGVRLAVGAVACRPLRLAAVEAAVTGRPRTEETATLAGELAVAGAVALRHNGYKIPLMRNLVRRAIRGTSAAQTT